MRKLKENGKEYLLINVQPLECNVALKIIGETEKDLVEFAVISENNLESPYQICEGCFYEFKLPEGYTLEKHPLIKIRNEEKNLGRIVPNIYVGNVKLNVIEKESRKECGVIHLEVISKKIDYRDEYSQMLKDISEKCIDLILRYSSPVKQNFEPDPNLDYKRAYQRFIFLHSLIFTEQFRNAVHRVISSPSTSWRETENIKDIRAARRIGSREISQIISNKNRLELPEYHPLKVYLCSVPAHLSLSDKKETVDTQENRFVKYVLDYFLSFITNLRRIAEKEKKEEGSVLLNEARSAESQLENWLNSSIFREVSRIQFLPLNSPILQRKEGYREILNAWLMFAVAAKLVWKGGDDVYEGGKKDVATLYEYWLFFKLLEIIKDIFSLKPKDVNKLFKLSKNRLNLTLKSGKHKHIRGIYSSGERKLKVEFSYNRTFKVKDYPKGGSWSSKFRPDYTLSFWPENMTWDEAELRELIVHIHFDAKYRTEELTGFKKTKSKDDLPVESETDNAEFLDNEKEDEKKGIYKRADLIKMHAYRDAIRRTGGAYILYPGDYSSQMKGFHEIIPGLGAFNIKPSGKGDGSEELKEFICETVKHFLNRTSQREKLTYHIYDIHKDAPRLDINENITDYIPPAWNGNKRLPSPDETFVIVGYYKRENWDWIVKKGLYNCRAGKRRGYLRLGVREASAEYLLLHTEGETKTKKLLKIVKQGPVILSKQDLIDKKYPSVPTGDYYVVYEIERNIEEVFPNKIWDVTKLNGYKTGQTSAIPFAVSITELMKATVKT